VTTERIDEIILASTNQGKLAELKELLRGRGVTVRGLEEFAQLSAAPENGKTFAENARTKALYYAEALSGWVLADDSGLQVDALAGAPGVHSARFANVAATDAVARDAANNRKVLELLVDVPTEKRTARFCCCLCLCKDAEVRFEVDGVLSGVIADQPQGRGGFGYDPIFYLPTSGKTVAQLSRKQKNAISHRGQALQRLVERLTPFLRDDQTPVST